MKTLHNNYCNSKQGYLPLFLSDCLDLLDPVLTFDRLMGGIDLNKYLTDIPEYTTGRLRYNPVNMLKTVLFGFMTSGYCSLRELEDNCKVNIRFMYLMDHQTPSYRTFGYFINEILQDKIENIFNDINHAIFNDEHVDLQHLYIDGSKFEANANKYTWVWKKATEKFRYKLYEKITAEIEEINAEIAWSGVQITTNPEYVPDYLNEIVEQLVLLWELDTSTFVYGSGKRKSKEQRHYEHLTTFCQKLQEYIQKIEICGPNRNSYSKTDNSATFMRIKTDYMGNDQLLPAYNVQIGVADEYIAVVDVNHYRSDMDCFVPLMEHFKQTYGFYPKYPVADALEAYASMMASDYTDGLALNAIKLVFNYLPRAYKDGSDVEARQHMANASCMAGMAFANAFLGVNHSLAHKLGAFHHIPHGIANALVLLHVLRYNAAEVPAKMGTFPQYQYPHTLARYAEIGRSIGLTGKNDSEVFEKLLQKLQELMDTIEIKHTIKEYGVDEKYFLETLDEMTEQAFNDQCTGANPRYPLMSELKEIYLKAYYGEGNIPESRKAKEKKEAK